MKVVILGRGNLAEDLLRRARAVGHEVQAWEMGRPLLAAQPLFKTSHFIFNTVGGRIESSIEELVGMNLTVNRTLARLNKDQTLVSFSSNAALGFPRSAYGWIKAEMEEIATEFTNWKTIQVSNLYGTHRPHDCFLSRVVQNRPKMLPSNWITPTPTDWIANRIFKDDGSIETPRGICPLGITTPHAFARRYFPEILMGSNDPTRPDQAIIDPGSNDHWETLWNQRKSFWESHWGLSEQSQAKGGST